MTADLRSFAHPLYDTEKRPPPADLVRQFDAIFHFDHTRALEPLEEPEQWQHEELPETFPSGI